MFFLALALYCKQSLSSIRTLPKNPRKLSTNSQAQFRKPARNPRKPSQKQTLSKPAETSNEEQNPCQTLRNI